MGIIDRGSALEVKDSVQRELKGATIASSFYSMMNEFHSIDNVWDDYNIEKVLLKQQELDTEGIKNREPKRTDIVTFNPSAASKCPRELFYKNSALVPDGLTLYPYNRRWASNGTAVHSRIQRDLLYAEKLLRDCPFKVATAKDLLGDLVKDSRADLPAWENNILVTKEFTHKGVTWAIRGMSDGYLWYKDRLINLEIKTKSTTVVAVGNYKMKEPMHSHKMQCICYSLLFMGDPYEDRTDTSILFYESLAKDGWTKGAEARPDLRVFNIEVTREMRLELMDKFSMVATSVQNGEIPFAETDKCLFCNYKQTCEECGAICKY